MSTIREVSRWPDCTPSWSQVAASSFRGRRLLGAAFSGALSSIFRVISGRNVATANAATSRKEALDTSIRDAGLGGPGLFDDLDLQLQELHNRVASVGIGLLIGHQSSPTRFRNEAGYMEYIS